MNGYLITVLGEAVQICANPRYVKIDPDTGCYVQCSREEAIGLAVNGTVYNVQGGTAIEGMPEAVAKEVDISEILYDAEKKVAEQQGIIDALLGATAETEVIADE